MKMESHFELDQKVWFILYDPTFDFAYCAEGIIEEITLQSCAEGVVSEMYKVEYYENGEYKFTERGVGNLFTSRRKMLRNLENREYVYRKY